MLSPKVIRDAIAKESRHASMTDYIDFLRLCQEEIELLLSAAEQQQQNEENDD